MGAAAPCLKVVKAKKNGLKLTTRQTPRHQRLHGMELLWELLPALRA